MQVVTTSQALFKRDSTGKIRTWYSETGTDGVNWGWRTNSGIHDGKIVTSDWKIVDQKNVGKANETSLEQQADAEAHAELVKKRDRGYFDQISDIDKFDKIKPMLASKYEDHKFDYVKNYYFSQPKLDGIRCVARANGLYTRAGKQIVAAPHIEKQLSALFSKYPNLVLDGELYNHDLKDDFNKITSLVRKAKPKPEDLVETASLVQYHVYDVIRMPDANQPSFSDRINWIIQQGFKGSVQVVNTKAIIDSQSVDDLYGGYLQAGYEGQMLRVDALYQENKRSKTLIKRKEFLSDEFKVVSVEEGKGNWSGYIKRFVLEMPDGTQFGSGVRGNQDVLKALFKNNEKPSWATCRYFTPTPDGIPRFPVVIDWGTGQRED